MFRCVAGRPFFGRDFFAQRRRSRSRCQRRTVSAVTNRRSPARRALGNRPSSSAMIARSAQSGRGRFLSRQVGAARRRVGGVAAGSRWSCDRRRTATVEARRRCGRPGRRRNAGTRELTIPPAVNYRHHDLDMRPDQHGRGSRQGQVGAPSPGAASGLRVVELSDHRRQRGVHGASPQGS